MSRTTIVTALLAVIIQIKIPEVYVRVQVPDIVSVHPPIEMYYMKVNGKWIWRADYEMSMEKKKNGKNIHNCSSNISDQYNE